MMCQDWHFSAPYKHLFQPMFSNTIKFVSGIFSKLASLIWFWAKQLSYDIDIRFFYVSAPLSHLNILFH